MADVVTTEGDDFGDEVERVLGVVVVGEHVDEIGVGTEKKTEENEYFDFDGNGDAFSSDNNNKINNKMG